MLERTELEKRRKLNLNQECNLGKKPEMEGKRGKGKIERYKRDCVRHCLGVQ